MRKLIAILLIVASSSDGAVVVRYFGVSAAGAGNGTTHADRAALFTTGNWSTVITGFAFNGTDALEARVETGSYTCSQVLASGLFTNAPSAANPLYFVGADSSAGNPLAVPSAKWKSCEPPWSTSTLPVIATTTNISTSSLSNTIWTLIAFTASGRNASITTGGTFVNWCSFINSTANTAAIAFQSSPQRIANSVFKCTGTSYDSVVTASSGNQALFYNCRIEGVTGSSGNRRGVTMAATPVILDQCTIVNNGGEGVIDTTASTTPVHALRSCVIANNGSDGYKSSATASQTEYTNITNCIVTGNGGSGINGNTNAGRFTIAQSRFRNNTTADFTAVGNLPVDINIDTSAGTDAAEYVSTGADGDFTIRSTSAIAGKGYGVAEQVSSGTTSGGFLIQ